MAYSCTSAPGSMLRDLLIALGLPLLLLLVVVTLLERGGGGLPASLQRLTRHTPLLWSVGMVLIIGVSLLRWLLQR
jgi:hypothetical protein